MKIRRPPRTAQALLANAVPVRFASITCLCNRERARGCHSWDRARPVAGGENDETAARDSSTGARSSGELPALSLSPAPGVDRVPRSVPARIVKRVQSRGVWSPPAGLTLTLQSSHLALCEPTGQSPHSAAPLRWWIAPPGSASGTRRRPPHPTSQARGGARGAGRPSAPCRRRLRWRSRRRPRRSGGRPVTPSSGATSGPSRPTSPSCPSRFAEALPTVRFPLCWSWGKRHAGLSLCARGARGNAPRRVPLTFVQNGMQRSSNYWVQCISFSSLLLMFVVIWYRLLLVLSLLRIGALTRCYLLGLGVDQRT
jgi:hypothetical protein